MRSCRSRPLRASAQTDAFARVEASLEGISTRLDRLESTITDGPSDPTATAEDQDDG